MVASPYILLTAGSNAKGQLGIGSYDDIHTFTPCQFANSPLNQLPDRAARVTHVACGANHTVLLLQHTDGTTTLWGAGDGRRGQLGPAYRREEEARWTVFCELKVTTASGEIQVPPVSRPVLCDSCPGPGPASGYTYKFVAAAWETTYIVLSHPEGSYSDVLLSMGSNEFGALGVEEGEDVGLARARAGHGSSSRRHRCEPRVVSFDGIFVDDAFGRHALHERISIQSLNAGPRHVVVQLVMTYLNADGSSLCSRTALVGWGASRHGQLGPHVGMRCIARPTRLPIDVDAEPMVSCALGNQHTAVLHASGRISTLGSNKQGQLPSLDGSQAHMRLCGLGCTWNGTYMHTVDGDRHALLSTGNGAQGQLGRDQSTPAVDMVAGLPSDWAISNFVCGSEHVLVAMSGSSEAGNSVWGWGWNEHGNMGLGSVGNVTIPTKLWPREQIAEAYDEYSQMDLIGIWAGCATSWLLVEQKTTSSRNDPDMGGTELGIWT